MLRWLKDGADMAMLTRDAHVRPMRPAAWTEAIESRVDDIVRLVYLLQPDALVLVALAHERRKPGSWRDRLTSS